MHNPKNGPLVCLNAAFQGVGAVPRKGSPDVLAHQRRRLFIRSRAEAETPQRFVEALLLKPQVLARVVLRNLGSPREMRQELRLISPGGTTAQTSNATQARFHVRTEHWAFEILVLAPPEQRRQARRKLAVPKQEKSLEQRMPRLHSLHDIQAGRIGKHLVEQAWLHRVDVASRPVFQVISVWAIFVEETVSNHLRGQRGRICNYRPCSFSSRLG